MVDRRRRVGPEASARAGLWLSFFICVTSAAHAAGPESAASPADAKRHAEVAQRGAAVMPFDLAKTTHVFTKTASGGTQRVVAKNRADVDQVRLVRSHLRAVGTQFERGDFSAPQQIHGESMAGLEALRNARGAVTVRYADVPGGGLLTYSSRDSELISALHRWFDAQLSDHGHDARAGHAHSDGVDHSMHRH